MSCRLPMARSEVIRSPAAVGSDPPPPMGFLTFLLFCWRQSGTKLGLECGRREYQSVSETFFDEKQPERSTTTALENNPKNTTHSGGDLEFSLQHGVYGVPLTHPLNMPVRVPLPPPSSPSCTALPPPLRCLAAFPSGAAAVGMLADCPALQRLELHLRDCFIGDPDRGPTSPRWVDGRVFNRERVGLASFPPWRGSRTSNVFFLSGLAECPWPAEAPDCFQLNLGTLGGGSHRSRDRV